MRLFRGLLVAAIALCAVVAILVAALNFYLGLPGTSARLVTRASAALGLPLSFGSLQVNVVKGITGTDFRIANAAAPGAPVLLAAPAIEATYAPQALLEHRLLLRQISFDRPVAVLQGDADGGLVLPPLPDTAEAKAFRGQRVIVKSFNADGGILRLLGPGGGPLLSVEGIALGGRLEQGGTWKGSGQFSAKSLLVGPFPSANLQGSYDIADGVFKFAKLIGTTCHGQLAGGFQLNVRAAGTPCDFQLQGSALDLNELLKSAFTKPDLVSGTLGFTATGRKTGAAWTAQGSFELHDGQLIHVDFIDQIVAALGLKDLAQPDFSAGRGDFALDQQTVTLSGLELKGAAFGLAGSGTLSLADGTAKLDLVLTLQSDLVKQLSPAVTAQLEAGDNGSKTLHVVATGSLDHLKTATPVHP